MRATYEHLELLYAEMWIDLSTLPRYDGPYHEIGCRQLGVWLERRIEDLLLERLKCEPPTNIST